MQARQHSQPTNANSNACRGFEGSAWVPELNAQLAREQEKRGLAKTSALLLSILSDPPTVPLLLPPNSSSLPLASGRDAKNSLAGGQAGGGW